MSTVGVTAEYRRVVWNGYGTTERLIRGGPSIPKHSVKCRNCRSTRYNNVGVIPHANRSIVQRPTMDMPQHLLESPGATPRPSDHTSGERAGWCIDRKNMGSSHSATLVSRMEGHPPPPPPPSTVSSLSRNDGADASSSPAAAAGGESPTTKRPLSSTPPPSMIRPDSLSTRVWNRFQERPLLPIGCGITAYFLFSGIHYFQKRDPINSHRMMRYRVAAQFMTLACFFVYLGGDQVADFRIAPKFQDKYLPQSRQGTTTAEHTTTPSHDDDKSDK